MTKLEFTPEMDVSPTPSSLNGLHPKFCSFFLFYCPMGHFEWDHHQKKIESWEASQNSSFYVRMDCLPFSSAIYLRRGGFWAKDMR
jgi:hypothetical protein